MRAHEFKAKVKVAAFERAKKRCQECGAGPLGPGNVEFDHDIPVALGGESSLDNCVVRCKTCHDTKTRTKDVPRIAKAKRQEKMNLGAKVSKNPMPCGRRSKWKKLMNGKVVLR